MALPGEVTMATQHGTFPWLLVEATPELSVPVPCRLPQSGRVQEASRPEQEPGHLQVLRGRGWGHISTYHLPSPTPSVHRQRTKTKATVSTCHK